MPNAQDSHVDNIVVGSGEVFLDIFDDDGNRTGERYVGDAVSASLTTESERFQVFSGTGQTAKLLVDTVRSVARSMTIVLHDVSMANLAAFFSGGDPSDVAAVTAQVADESLGKIKAGVWYQLGATYSGANANPRGVGKLNATPGIAIKAHATSGSETTVSSPTAGTDYVLDGDRGRIMFPGTNKIMDGWYVRVTYTPASEARKQVTTAGLKVLKGAVRYLEDSGTGKGRDFYVPQSTIAPGGEMALMSRDTEQQITLSCSIEEPGGDLAAVYIDGVDA